LRCRYSLLGCLGCVKYRSNFKCKYYRLGCLRCKRFRCDLKYRYNRLGCLARKHNRCHLNCKYNRLGCLTCKHHRFDHIIFLFHENFGDKLSSVTFELIVRSNRISDKYIKSQEYILVFYYQYLSNLNCIRKAFDVQRIQNWWSHSPLPCALKDNKPVDIVYSMS
jgi:hypothetical protein